MSILITDGVMAKHTNVFRFSQKSGKQHEFDGARHLLEELYLKLGGTDPVLGAVVFEKHMI
jgi:uncharacterized protein with GYD domain